MTLNELVQYLATQDAFTIAQIQQQFSLGYAEVRQLFSQLEQDGKIYLESGVTFKWVANQRPVAEQSEQSNDKQSSEESERDRKIRLQREQLLKRLAELSEEAKKDKVEVDEDEDDDECDIDALFDDDDEILDLIEEDTTTTVGEEQPTDDTVITELITNKLQVFGVKLQISNVFKGPAVTQYVFNVLFSKDKHLEKYADDIGACVNSPYPVRMVKLPGNKVAVEIVNAKKNIVTLDSVIKSKAFSNSKGQLDFVLGKDLHNNNIVVDLATMPHLLIAGATGTGKSTVLHSLIISIASKYTPNHVRFVMVDPKFIELSRYNGLPHMLTPATITNVADTLAALDYLINEMEHRYNLMRANGSCNITEYNGKTQEKMPYLVFIVDELADLMYDRRHEFEQKLMRLAQKSRAAGIHIVLATQRPDVRTVTGTIKANTPCRIALKMTCLFDSRTVINGDGAELLSGFGDMLFLSPHSSELNRIQGAYVSNEEIRAIVEQMKDKYPAQFNTDISKKIFVVEGESNAHIAIDPLCKEALRFFLVKNGGKASIAALQRSLGIGFNRAGRIMDTLQKLGYVETLGEDERSVRALRVLVTLEEVDILFPD